MSDKKDEKDVGQPKIPNLDTISKDDTFQSIVENSADSPASTLSTEDFVSASAPVDIPVFVKSESISHRPHSNTPSPIHTILDEFKDDTPFGSFAMTQSLRSDPDVALHAPRVVQRAISTSPRIEHNPTLQPDENELSNVEDPFFPFLNPDLGLDMINSNSEVSQPDKTDHQNDSNSITNVDKMEKENKKNRWIINKGLSEADIGPHKGVGRNSKSKLGSAFSAMEVPSKKVKNISSNPQQPMDRQLSRLSSKGLRRKSSISSNLSFVGNYVLGSNLFHSPTRSNASMASDKINIVTDSFGIYPSILSLTSVDVGILPFEDELVVPLSTSQPRSISAYSSRQNSRLDLEKDGADRKKSYMRSISNTSKGSLTSLSTKIYRDADEKTSLRDDEELDKITEVKSILRPQPPKKQWQQTMPDLVEGPESETLTVQSTVRKQLAAAALAIAMRDSKYKTTDGEMEDYEGEEEKKIINPNVYKKNLYVICAVFFFSFASYMSLRNLQSSLNDAGGLGMLSLSCIYAFLFIGSIFTTTIVQRLRPKLSMLASLMGLLLYNISNFYPCYGTLIPGACIAGFSLATIWTAQATYMANNSSSYAQMTNQRFQDILSNFHGIFFGFFQVSQMVGGVISSIIFSMHNSNFNNGTQLNEIYNNTNFNSSNGLNPTNWTKSKRSAEEMDDSYNISFVSVYNSWKTTNAYLSTPIYDFNGNGSGVNIGNSFFSHHVNYSAISDINKTRSCGMSNCPGHGTSSFKVEFDPAMYYIMVAVFLSSTICSILILLFCLDPLEGSLRNPRAGISIQLFSVFKMLTNPHILCILPLMSYTLLQTTFIFGEFNKAFVTCVLGIHMIGYLTVCLSLFSSIFAFVTGLLQKYVGPEIIIMTGLFMHMVLLTMMWVWDPSKEMSIIFFVIVAIWGAGDGMIVTQIISLLGMLFMDKKEAAFSTYKMAQSGSAFLMFITGPYLCTKVKVIITLTMNILAMSGYMILKLRLKRERISKATVTNVTVYSNDEKKQKNDVMKI